MSRAEVTLTQQKIKQELLRQGYRQKETKQSEYLKFQARSTEKRTLWVGRRGGIRQGRRFPTSIDITFWPVGVELRRAAKANYY